MRTIDEKLTCLKRVILNAQGHVRCGDSRRIYSQYIRYALGEFVSIHFYCSQNAAGRGRRDVIHDHVVPHAIVMTKLLALSTVTNDNLDQVISRYLAICAITREEDHRLSAAGLRTKMPHGWDENAGDVFRVITLSELSYGNKNNIELGLRLEIVHAIRVEGYIALLAAHCGVSDKARQTQSKCNNGIALGT